MGARDLRYLASARRATGSTLRRRATSAAAAVSLDELLQPSVEPLFHGEVSGALERREKARKLLLLGGEDIGALPLRVDEGVQLSRDLCLVRCRIRHRREQVDAGLPFLTQQGTPLLLEFGVDTLKRLHLLVVQVELSSNDLREGLAHLALKRLPARIRLLLLATTGTREWPHPGASIGDSLCRPMKMNGCALVFLGAPDDLEPPLAAICSWVAQALGENGASRVYRVPSR